MNDRLVTALCVESGITPDQAQKVLSGLGKIMARELAGHDTVSIGTLGTWKRVAIKAGLGKRADGAVTVRPPSYRITYKIDPYIQGRMRALARNRELLRDIQEQNRRSREHNRSESPAHSADTERS
jgi:hypothetical protein